MPQQDWQQELPAMEGGPRTDPNQTVLRPVHLRHMGGNKNIKNREHENTPVAWQANGSDAQQPATEQFNGNGTQHPVNGQFNGNGAQYPVIEQFNGTGVQQPAPEQFYSHGVQYSTTEQFNRNDTLRPMSAQFSSDAQRMPTGQFGGNGLQRITTEQLGRISIDDIPFEQRPTMQLPAIVVKGETQKNKKKSLMALLIRAAVTVALFAFLLKSMDWTVFIHMLAHVDHTYLLMGLAVGVLCQFFSAYGWHRVVLAENIKADLAWLIDLYLVGIGFSHFLPTSMGGDAVKAFYVGRNSGNMAGATSAALMSRITSFLGMLLISLPGLFLFRQYFNNQVAIEFVLLSLLLIVGIGSAFLAAAFLPGISLKLLKGKQIKNPLVARVVPIFGKFIEVGNALLASAKRPGPMIGSMVFGMLFWVTSFLNYYGYAMALGMHVPLGFYVVAIPFVSIIAALPISINGFGVKETAFVYLFSTMHVATPTSTLLALLMDAQVLFFGLIGGCIYFAMSKKVD
ncbi:MAG: flippase-like domain-containing protein [Chloroflexi bacterium]|nr:flippase-like domain-containing protein [Chloroflexota bacterium]